MNIKKYIIPLIVILIIGCTKRYIARYYILDYNPQINVENQLEKPFPYNLQVKKFKIDRTYDNSRIVIRQSAHQIYYDKFSLWARRPQEAITFLLINHINKLHIVKNCKERFIDDRPDFIISGQIHSIEKYQNDLLLRADIHISLTLTKVSTNQIVLNKEIVNYIPLYTNEMNYFAKTISDNLNKEFSSFILDMVNYFKSEEQTKL
ncbi:MAG: membrane integrity-associated transporter subunit PqiC [Candidatus Cloacimonetes bacterium]|nr:membrane integrity-associated transporter subunit PqiC [Candidatus Cloacimonadota bacterium]